jgi:hypothetical protein
LIAERDLPPPEEWESFDVYMGADEQRMSIHAADGYDYDVNVDGSIYDADGWDWMWDIWEWIAENYPDTDLDSHYE